MQGILDFEGAVKRAEDGVKRSASKASRLEPGWIEKTIEEVRAIVQARDESALFTIEEVRAQCAPMPAGSDARGWGQVTRRVTALGIIVRTGFFAPTASSNGSPKPIYRKGPSA